MKCPFCSHENTRVIDSRPAEDNNSIRRRRVCDECGKRFTTYEKIETIRHALELGMEVCSGGIIGMGETMEARVDLALTVRELGVKSIPMNVLNPIPGTPLEGAAPLTDEEVLTTVAVFRFINPDAFLRFAGGRALIAHIEEDAIRAGINSAIVGDLLTTIGSKVIEDMEKVKRLGFTTEDNL